MATKIGKKGTEGYTVVFEQDEFKKVKSLYAKREENTIRQNFDIALISDDCILTSKEVANLPESDEHLAFPSYKGARLFFKVHDMIYPMTSNALRTLGMRVKWNGESIQNLNEELLKEALLDLFGKAKGKDRVIKVIIIDRAVRAVMSSDYKIVPIKDVIDTLYEYTKQRFKNASFVGGSATYDKVGLLFNLHTEEKFALAYGKDVAWDGIIRVESSDTGFSSNIVKAGWKTDTGNIIFEDVAGKVRLIHKGNNDLAAFEKNLQTLFVKLHDRSEHIQKQLKCKVDNPMEMIDLIIDKEESPVLNKTQFKTLLGKKDAKKLKEMWEVKQAALKAKYEEYIALLDEDELEEADMSEFKVSMYDIIMLFVDYQNVIKPEKKELLEVFCGVLLVTDFAKFAE